MNNSVQSYKYKLNEADLIRVGFILLHVMVGTLITVLLQLVPQINFGIYQPAVVILCSILSGAFSQWISGPAAPSSEQIPG